MAQTKENITTIPLLPELETGNITGEEILYAIKGLGSDRDFCLKLKTLFDAMGFKVKATADDSNPHYLNQKLEEKNPQTLESPNYGDVGFEAVNTRGGKVLAAYIKDGHLKPSHVSQDENDEFEFKKINVTTEATFGKAQFSNPDRGSTNLTGLGEVEANVMDVKSIGVDVEEVTATKALQNTNGKKKGRTKLLYNSTENAVLVYYRQGSQGQYAVQLEPGYSKFFVFLGEDESRSDNTYIWSPID